MIDSFCYFLDIDDKMIKTSNIQVIKSKEKIDNKRIYVVLSNRIWTIELSINRLILHGYGSSSKSCYQQQ